MGVGRKRLNREKREGRLRVLRYMLKGRRARFVCGTNLYASEIWSLYMPVAKNNTSVTRETRRDAMLP